MSIAKFNIVCGRDQEEALGYLRLREKEELPKVECLRLQYARLNFPHQLQLTRQQHNISHQPARSESTMSLFSFSTPLDIDIVLQDTDERSTVDVKLDKNKREKCLLYLDGETVKGAVTIRPKDGKRLEHTGIKVQFVGTIGMESHGASRYPRKS